MRLRGPPVQSASCQCVLTVQRRPYPFTPCKDIPVPCVSGSWWSKETSGEPLNARPPVHCLRWDDVVSLRRSVSVQVVSCAHLPVHLDCGHGHDKTASLHHTTSLLCLVQLLWGYRTIAGATPKERSIDTSALTRARPTYPEGGTEPRSGRL